MCGSNPTTCLLGPTHQNGVCLLSHRPKFLSHATGPANVFDIPSATSTGPTSSIWSNWSLSAGLVWQPNAIRPTRPPGLTPPIVASQFQQPVGMVFLNYGMSPSYLPQATMLPHAFQTRTLQEPNWNIDTGASSHLAENTVRQFARDNNVSVDFDAYGFSVKDYQTRQILLRCDSTDDLYPVTQQPSTTTTFTFILLSPTTWHRRLGYPSEDVFRRLESSRFISCNKTKLSALCHACKLGKHTRLPFYSSESSVAPVFDIIHSDLWPSQVKVVLNIMLFFGSFLALCLGVSFAS
ncbi:ribonuclease H-like domain-containing protein [Tanacetum coccineum]